jgi:hypothetical protein
MNSSGKHRAHVSFIPVAGSFAEESPVKEVFVTQSIPSIAVVESQLSLKEVSSQEFNSHCESKLKENGECENEADDDLPMTGDPDIDNEILSFFRTRRAVFRKINQEKRTNPSKLQGTNKSIGISSS